MIWLIFHQWLLMLLSFLLGLLIGYWIWHRRSIDETRKAYAETPEIAAQKAYVPPPAKAAEVAPPAEVTPPQDTLSTLGKAGGAGVGGRAEFKTSTAPKLYDSPTDGPADDLKKIKGIGPNYEKLLNEIGIFYYQQIENWTPAEISWLDHKLEFPGRILRDNWQGQARTLSTGGSTEFANRYEKGETPSSYTDGENKD